jgi:protease I
VEQKRAEHGISVRDVHHKEYGMELQGKRVVVLVEDHYEDLELWYPTLRLREAGADVTLVGVGAAGYTSIHGIPVQVDTGAEQVHTEDFDAIVIPSGPTPEALGDHPALLGLVQAAIRQGKVVATTFSAGEAIVAAHDKGDESALRISTMNEDVVKDDTGLYKDSTVVRHGNLIMARTPVDLPAFCRMIIAALAEPARHPRL